MSGNVARIAIDVDRTIGEISPLLFGGFAEHMGRCIYGGIYEPTSPHADERGFRSDVLAALRELDFTIMRYPGGNFVSGYRWMDGIGPKERRPHRRELAWQSIETNQFGTDEFMAFCATIQAELMLVVNMGTGDLDEAAALVEYCNAPVGTYYADLRAANGHPDPYNVAYWCVGNEMDGSWQIGHLEMAEYGRKAREAAKMMKWHDPSTKLILCGSSNTHMSTYPEWDRVALEHAWEHVDYLSLHYYASNHENDTAGYLASAVQFERHLDTLAATLRYVKAKLRSAKDLYLSWDEWNIWYKERTFNGGWSEAPHLSEEVYNLEDALVAAQWLNVFLRRADVLKIACLAQIVNVISPILTTPTGLLKQSTFYPLLLARRFARGVSLDVLTRAPMTTTIQYGDVPLLDVAASYEAETGVTALFIVNRSLKESLPTEIVWQTGAPQRIEAMWQIAGTDPKAVNTFEQPHTITARRISAPALVDTRAQLELPPLSFTVLRAV